MTPLNFGHCNEVQMGPLLCSCDKIQGCLWYENHTGQEVQVNDMQQVSASTSKVHRWCLISRFRSPWAMNEDLYSLQKIKFTYMNLIDSHQSSLQTAFTFLYQGSDQNSGKTISSGSNKDSRTQYLLSFFLSCLCIVPS